MKKKVLLAVLAIAVVSATAGCGKSNEAADVKSEVTTEETTETSTETKEKVNIETSQYVTLPNYTALEVTVAPASVSDDDVLAYINSSILTSYPITDRAVEDGDTAKIDYVGKKDDVAFDGGTAEGYNLTIGSHTFIDGFEEGLVGVMPGDTVDLNLTFPEEYQSADLAGQDVVFTVTVQAVMETTDYDNVTMEQIEAMGLSYDSKEAIWDDAVKYCQEQADSTHDTDIQNAIFEKLLADTQFSEIPQALIDEKIDEYNTYMESICQQYYGCDLETYMTTYAGTSMDEYNTQLQDMATEATKQDMIFDAIAKAEKMEITDDELNKKAEEDATAYGYESAAALLEAADIETYRTNLLQQKVLDYLMESTKVIDGEVETEAVTTEEATTEEATTETAK